MAKEASSQVIHNIIAQGTTIVAPLVRITTSELMVHRGDLRCKGKVVIGSRVSLKGNIECENAEIMVVKMVSWLSRLFTKISLF